MHYSFHSTPTCTFKSRNETITKHNQMSSMPGPADYQVKKPLHQSATIAHTNQQRNLYKKFETNPGPGAYESKSHITDGVKRSISLRFIDYSKPSPGPHDYHNQKTKIMSKAPVYTLTQRSKSARQIDFDHNSYKPGPTSYQAKNVQSKQGPFIGSSTRKDLTETEKTPAPNNYLSESAADFRSISNPRCKIGGQFRDTTFGQGQKTPGPALYNKSSFVEQNVSKKRGYSCRQKVNDLVAQELSKVPAPGMYESHLKFKNTAPRCSTTQTKRKTFMDDSQKARKDSPGPGYHDPKFSGTKYRSTSANMFSKSQRRPLDQNEKTPGPVQYTKQKLNVMNSAPKFSSTRTVAKNQFLQVNPQNPSPDHYNPKLSLVKPGTATSQLPREKRPDFEKHRKTPGPGFYNLRGKEEGPTWKFSTQKRIAFTDQENQAKNGTHYELGSKVVDPPNYMNVNSKINFGATKTGFSTN